MARVTAEQIRAICSVSTTITDMSEFILTASTMVTYYLGDKGLSDELLERIELYLAAHLVKLKDRDYKRKKIDAAEDEYTHNTKLALNSTYEGSQVLWLDPTGTFNNLNTSANEGGYSRQVFYRVIGGSSEVD